MATRKVPAFTVLTDYTQAEEDTYAGVLAGSNWGNQIFNTTLAKIRIWNGTAFENVPAIPADIVPPQDWSVITNKPSTFAPSTHNHDASYSALGHVHANQGYVINVQALTSSPTDGQTIYFGTLPKAPVTTQGQSKIYIRAAGTIKRVEIYCFSGTAGTGEAWACNIRLNSSTDTLIQSLSVATSERVFSNAALNIAVVSGDYVEIKMVNPSWATNPLTTIFGGQIYIE